MGKWIGSKMDPKLRTDLTEISVMSPTQAETAKMLGDRQKVREPLALVRYSSPPARGGSAAKTRQRPRQDVETARTWHFWEAASGPPLRGEGVRLLSEGHCNTRNIAS
jgi:hypothetical protein